MSSIIQTLKAEGVLKLYHDYRSSEARDLSGNSNDGTYTSTEWANGGLRFGNAGFVTVSDSAELQLTTGTIIIFGDFDAQASRRMLVKKDAGGTNYDFLMTAATITFYDGTNTRTLTTSIVNKKYVAVNFANGGTPEGFVDGISVGNFSGTVAISVDDADVLVGNIVGGSQPFPSTMKAALIVNRVLTATEHAQLYAELSDMKWPNKKTEKALKSTLPNLDDPTLIGAWNVPVNGSLLDLSSQGNNGTLTNIITTEKWIGGDAMIFSGSDYIDLGDVALYDSQDSYTISCWIKSTATAATKRVFSKGAGPDQYSWSLDVNGSEYAVMNMFQPDGSAYAGATGTTNVSDGLWHHIVGTMDKTAGAKIYVDGTLENTDATVSGTWGQNKTSNVRIGSIGITQIYSGSLSNLQFFNEVKDADWVANENQRGASAVQYKTDYGVDESIANVTSGELENSGWEVSTGSWKITMDTINGQNVKVLKLLTAVGSGGCIKRILILHHSLILLPMRTLRLKDILYG
jgi:hypothetical protein